METPALESIETLENRFGGLHLIHGAIVPMEVGTTVNVDNFVIFT